MNASKAWLALVLSIGLAGCGGAAAPASSPAAASSAAAAGASSAKPAASSAPATSAAASAKPAAKPSGGPSTAASGAAQAGKITLAYINISGSNITLFVTHDGGYFQKHGLDVDMQFINGASKGMAAMLSNQVDICHCGAEVVNANVAGADLVVTATLTPVYPYKFEAAPSIKTFNDLKGKAIGMSSIGGAVDIVTRLVLQKNGINPDKDVVLVPDNGSTFRIDAMLGGATVAAMADPPGLQKVEAQGFHTLANPAGEKIPTANSTVVAQRSWVAGHKDLMQRYIDALMEGTNRAKHDKAFAVSVMKKYFKSDDDKVMGDTWDFFANEVEPDVPLTTVNQFTDTINGLAKQNPKVKDYDVSQAIDMSFVNDAVKRGVGK